MNACKHPTVYPDGTCATCGVLATCFPGFSTAHKMIWYPARCLYCGQTQQDVFVKAAFEERIWTQPDCCDALLPQCL